MTENDDHVSLWVFSLLAVVGVFAAFGMFVFGVMVVLAVMEGL